MSIGTIIGIAAAASVLAHTAAARRNRSPQGWAVLAFLFPITLIVLWFLPSRQPAARPVPAAKPAGARPSGWADTLAPSTGQHLAMNERSTPAASLAENW